MYNPINEELPTQEDFAFLMDVLKKADQQQQQKRSTTATTTTTTTTQHVRFASAPMMMMTAAATPNPLTMEDLKDSWYSANELNELKMQARILLRGINSTSTSECRRGFEFTNPLRQKHRRMSIRCTLSAARKGLRGEPLGQVARRCTQWNTDIAFLQGCHDYAHAYNPPLVAMMPPIGENPPAFPFAVKSSKRYSPDNTATTTSTIATNDNATSTRNVRQRLTLRA